MAVPLVSTVSIPGVTVPFTFYHLYVYPRPNAVARQDGTSTPCLIMCIAISGLVGFKSLTASCGVWRA